MENPYKIEGDRVSQAIDTGCGLIVFTAENIRKERTGIHANIYVLFHAGGKPDTLAWSNFNIERSGERGRLCRDAYKEVGRLFKEIYTVANLTKDFDRFCMGLFSASMAVYKGEALKGSIERKEQNFILKPYVIEGGGTILYAPPDRGKSWLGLLMAISIDAGHTGFWNISQRKVMFINLERSKGLVKDRIGNVNRALGLPAERSLYTLSARGRSLSDVKMACEFGIKENDIDLILLDSISRTGFGTLVEDRPANAIIDTLSYLCPTWIAIAHTSKADDKAVYGSQMFNAGMDIGVQLITESYESKLGIGLKIRKGNDIPKPRTVEILALNFDKIGLTGIRWADDGEFGNIEKSDKPESDFESIHQYLKTISKDYVRNIASETGLDPGNVSRLLHSRKDVFTEIGDSGPGKPKFWGLITHEYE